MSCLFAGGRSVFDCMNPVGHNNEEMTAGRLKTKKIVGLSESDEDVA